MNKHLGTQANMSTDLGSQANTGTKWVRIEGLLALCTPGLVYPVANRGGGGGGGGGGG